MSDDEAKPAIRKSVYEISKPADSAHKSTKEAKENLWKKILSDVAQRDGQRDVTVLLLGDKGSGKRSLIREMNAKHVLGRPKKLPVDKMGSDFAALDFSFLFVKDLSDKENSQVGVDAEDNTGKINIFSVQDADKIDLLEAVLTPSHLERTTAAIILDLDRPWDLMSQLQSWMTALQNLLFKLLPEMQPGCYERMKSQLVNSWKLYEEPQLDDQGNLIKKLKVEDEANSDDDEKETIEDVRLEMDLPEGVLKVNLGIPIMVVVSKVDVLLHGEKKQFLEANLDFIQKHVREYCLAYGASVCFASANANKNLDCFYQSIVSKHYGFDFGFRPEVIERDALFLPAGFDSPSLIEELTRAAKIANEDPDGRPILYEDVIVKPPSNANSRQGGRTLAARVDECADWNALLHERLSGSPTKTAA